MAISFPHKSREEITKQYNCWGLLAFLVPVYATLYEDEDGDLFLAFGHESGVFPKLEELNWIPRPFYYIGMAIAGAWMAMSSGWGREVFPFVPIGEVT